jgi:small subunit ribosomal protein S16
VAVKIRLKRMGKIRAPFYRVVVMDSRTKRDGRAIEEIGKYHPTEQPSLIDVDTERVQYWLAQGAQPTEAVVALLKVTGDWAKHTGEGDPAGSLQVKAPKKSKRELYESAVAATGKTVEVKENPAPRKKAPAKVEEAPAKVEEAPAKIEEAPAKVEEVAAAADGGYGPDSAAPHPDGSGPEGFDVKGNKDSMKYHEPDGQWYAATVAEVWFRTAEAAQAAGFVKAGS